MQCKGSSILGRDWFSHLRLDWKEIHQLHQLQHDDPLQKMLAQHQVVFQEGLGTLRGYKAEIYVDEGARPKFCKAQTVPYSLRVKVEEELDRRVKEGILEPVQFAEWAAPIAAEEKANALDAVLTRLENAGPRLKRQKCFLLQSVDTMGHQTDARGLHPLPEKLQAIQEAPPPKNVLQLKSYLGLLGYYSKFLPNLSSTLFPLYRLLRHSTPWCWTKKEPEAFYASKQLISSAPLLVHFDPELEIILAFDASAYGLGAVLAYRMPDGSERPVEYASCTLTKMGQDYSHSQIEKEGLACMYGVTKFRSYLYGHHFGLITEHKPRLTLVNENCEIPPQASSRILCWALTLAAYEYTLVFCPTTQHGKADAMSRLPLPQKPKETPLPAEFILLVEHLEQSPVTASHIKTWTRRDPLLARVSGHFHEGRPPERLTY